MKKLKSDWPVPMIHLYRMAHCIIHCKETTVRYANVANWPDVHDTVTFFRGHGIRVNTEEVKYEIEAELVHALDVLLANAKPRCRDKPYTTAILMEDAVGGMSVHV